MKVENPFRLGFLAALGAIAALVLGGMLSSLGTVLTYVGAALFLALGFEPLIAFLERRRWPRSAAMVVSLLAVFGAITLIVLAIIPSVTEQVIQLSGRYNVLVEQLANSNLIEWADKTFPGLDAQKAVQDALTWLQENIGVITGGVLQVGFGIVNGFFGALIIFILTLYFVASMNSIKRAFFQLVPASRRARAAEITEEITGSVGKYVVGQGGLALVNGILTFIFLSVIGASMPAVFAIVAFAGSLIPLVGTLSAAAIIVLSQLALLPTESPVWWIAGIYYLVYMQVEAYIVSPRIMSQAVSVPGPIVVIAALTGGTLLGLLGAMVAIPVAASLLIIVNKVIIPAQNER